MLNYFHHWMTTGGYNPKAIAHWGHVYPLTFVDPNFLATRPRIQEYNPKADDEAIKFYKSQATKICDCNEIDGIMDDYDEEEEDV
jgi:hypothetical protein